MPAAKDEFTQPELLYQTVENDILKKIVSGELPGGSQIPTETELCKQYKVSRITVRRAVQNLIDQSLLYRLRGKGTFVNPSKLTLKRGTSTIFNLSADPQYGDKTTKSILETGLIKADAHIARELKIDNGTVVQRVARLVYIENAPLRHRHRLCNAEHSTRTAGASHRQCQSFRPDRQPLQHRNRY